MFDIGAVVIDNVREHSNVDRILHHHGKSVFSRALMIVACYIKERNTAEVGVIAAWKIAV